MKHSRCAHRFCVLLLTLAVLPVVPSVADEDDKPLARIAAVSNLYLTTLSAKELGASRGWIASTAPAGIEQTIERVNAVNPDAFVVLGNLTWTGSESDFELVRKYLSQIKARLLVTPGENDLPDEDPDRYLKYFGEHDVSGKGITIRNVHLQFSRGHSRQKADVVRKSLEETNRGLSGAAGSKAALLFGSVEFPALRETDSAESNAARFWKLIHDHKVAALFTPGHSHQVRYSDSLPVWSLPSTGWSYSPKFLLALITVYAERIELTLLREPDQPVQSLVIPNPVTAERMPTSKDDPYGVPTYSEDLARKPDLTFVQLSDSQFDDKTVPRYRSRYAYDEPMNELAVSQVNRLKPAMTFMTGDLTNKNTAAEWKTFNRIYSKLKSPFYPLPGNHDTLYDRSKLDQKTLGDLLAPGQANWKLADMLAGKRTDDRTTLYQHFTGKKPYYSVEKNGCVFLCLNTGVADVDAEQMKWFRSELERTKDAKHVFVLGHYPVLPQFGNSVQGPVAQEILTLLRQYRVTAYLSGHRHRYGYRVHDGVTHVLCDCLCWGEYRSFQIYHVFPDKVVACWKPIFRADGNRPLYERVEFPEPRFKGAD